MTSTNPNQSILKSLRALVPTRDCTFGEALVIAEQQAIRLGDLVARSTPVATVSTCRLSSLCRDCGSYLSRCRSRA